MAVHQNLTPQSGSDQRWPDWRRGLPELPDGTRCRLRELRSQDAPALLAHLNDSTVLEYLAPSPATVEGFRRFIRWTRDERRRGRHACYGILPAGAKTPVGTLQIWPIERDFSVAEWGFVLGRSYWGTGLFVHAARRLLDAIFVDGLFGPPGVLRLEARAADANGRGNGVLRKLGATREGILRGSFVTGDVNLDHVMWSILAREWPALRHRDHNVS